MPADDTLARPAPRVLPRARVRAGVQEPCELQVCPSGLIIPPLGLRIPDVKNIDPCPVSVPLLSGNVRISDY